MREFTVMFRSVIEIAQFVNAVNRYPFHVWLSYGTAKLDGKSLLSLCSLRLNTPLTLTISDAGQDLECFFADLRPFLVETAAV